MRGYSCLILVHSRTATVQVRNWNFSLGLTPGLDTLPCAVFPLTRSRGFDLQQPDGEIQALLTELRSGLPYYAWTAFLTTYSGLIYGVIHMFAHEPDHTADCFLFVCEKLAENNYRRILAFKPDGKARFTTWARAVVRNLCLDWHRSQFGRKQVFSSVAARVRRGGQHRVLGGDPAEARARSPTRDAVGDARGAQHAGLAELDQHRTGRPFLEPPGDLDVAELVVVPAIFSRHGEHSRTSPRTPSPRVRERNSAHVDLPAEAGAEFIMR